MGWPSGIPGLGVARGEEQIYRGSRGLAPGHSTWEVSRSLKDPQQAGLVDSAGLNALVDF
jgi:hypothetical protein